VKLVVAVIQPTKLGAVREALERIEVTRMTICDAQAFEERRGAVGTHCDGPQSDSRQLDLFPFSAATLLQKIVLEIVVNDDFLDRTVETVVNSSIDPGPTRLPIWAFAIPAIPSTGDMILVKSRSSWAFSTAAWNAAIEAWAASTEA